MMTTNLFVVANVKQLRTDGSFGILLPFTRTSWGDGFLNSAIFNSFYNRVEFGSILEGLRNFAGGGGVWAPRTPLLGCKRGLLWQNRLKSFDIATCFCSLLSSITSGGVTRDRTIFVDECRRFQRTSYLHIQDSAIKRVSSMGLMYWRVKWAGLWWPLLSLSFVLRRRSVFCPGDEYDRFLDIPLQICTVSHPWRL